MVGGRPSESEFKPPRGLSRDARKFWNEVVPQLVEACVVDRVDLAILERLARAWGRIKEAELILDREGLTSVGSKRQLRAHPALQVLKDAESQFLRISEQVGITPVARTRLGIGQVRRRTLAQELERELGPRRMRPVGLVEGERLA